MVLIIICYKLAWLLDSHPRVCSPMQGPHLSRWHFVILLIHHRTARWNRCSQRELKQHWLLTEILSVLKVLIRNWQHTQQYSLGWLKTILLNVIMEKHPPLKSSHFIILHGGLCMVWWIQSMQSVRHIGSRISTVHFVSSVTFTNHTTGSYTLSCWWVKN